VKNYWDWGACGAAGDSGAEGAGVPGIWSGVKPPSPPLEGRMDGAPPR
jgi:hypothetical protein